MSQLGQKPPRRSLAGAAEVHPITDTKSGGWRVSSSKQNRKERMVDNPIWEICERVAEVHALLDDHIAGGEHSAADVVAKARAVLSEAELLRAMFEFGYFPPNMPP
jgi:hypothetical protein